MSTPPAVSADGSKSASASMTTTTTTTRVIVSGSRDDESYDGDTEF